MTGGDTSPDLAVYIEALTHSSWSQEHGGTNNERLEFLGDAVLQLATSLILYRPFPDADEGALSRMRKRLVNNRFLAELAKSRELGALMRFGHGEEASGGRDRQRNLAGGFEAILGAIYIKEGFTVAMDVIEANMSDHLHAASLHVDSKQCLHEWVQANHKTTPQYEVTGVTGPDHARVYSAVVIIEGRRYDEGTGSSKQKAMADAASKAAQRLGLVPRIQT